MRSEYLKSRTVVVTKSTIPLGNGDEIENILRERRPDAEIRVVSMPRRLKRRCKESREVWEDGFPMIMLNVMRNSR